MRLFTLEEASGLLPEVIPVLERLREATTALAAQRTEAASAAHHAAGNGHLTADPFAGDDAAGVRAEHEQAATDAITQLEIWGIELKDPERGLIDFYWERESEVVFLCFLLGEPEIGWWHRLDAGFAGRTPLAH